MQREVQKGPLWRTEMGLVDLRAAESPPDPDLTRTCRFWATPATYLFTYNNAPFRLGAEIWIHQFERAVRAKMIDLWVVSPGVNRDAQPVCRCMRRTGSGGCCPWLRLGHSSESPKLIRTREVTEFGLRPVIPRTSGTYAPFSTWFNAKTICSSLCPFLGISASLAGLRLGCPPRPEIHTTPGLVFGVWVNRHSQVLIRQHSGYQRGCRGIAGVPLSFPFS